MDLLSALWPDPNRAGDLTLWMTPGKRSYHFALRELPLSTADYDELRVQADTETWNVYFGLGLRREGLAAHQQGGKKDILALPALALDIDFANPRAHKAKNLPRDLDEAECLLAGEPDPSAIIHTGNGVHVYWFLRHAIELLNAKTLKQAHKAYKAFQARFIKRANDKGWQLDSTSTVQRVWRLPGFVNQKTNKPVRALYVNPDERYTLEDLGVGGIVSASGSQTATTSSSTPTPSSQPRQFKSPDFKALRRALENIQANNAYHDAIQKLLAGESMAEPGSRDIVLQGVCSTIAWLPEGREADPMELAEFLRPTLQEWAAEQRDDGVAHDLDDDLRNAADKIERSQQDWRAQQEAKRPQLDALARALGKRTGNGVPNEFIEQHAIIQKRSLYYAFDFRPGKQRYSHPLVNQGELQNYLKKIWEVGPIDLYFRKEDGAKKRKQVGYLLEHHSEVAVDVIGDLTLQESRYDIDEEVFFEAVSPRRVHEPLFNKDIDTWLHLLVGVAVDAGGHPIIEKLLDWIAAVPQLQHQCCVLYLDGVSGSGKGLLANGLSRLWTTGGPTPFGLAIDNFNSHIASCPLLFADEALPRRKGDITAELRALIGSSTLTLNEKNIPHRKVNGAVRLMMAANNDEALMLGNDSLTLHDLEAVVGRFLYVQAQREAADWLKAKNAGGHMTNAWVNDDLIARHCLALAETRQINPGKRFLVEGTETAMHRKLLMQGMADGVIHEWLVRFATKPGVIVQRYASRHEFPKAYLQGGHIFVNAEGVIDCWDAYLDDKVRCPPTRKINSALKKIAVRQVRRGPRGNRAYFHEIKPELVIELSQELQIGSGERINTNVQSAPKTIRNYFAVLSGGKQDQKQQDQDQKQQDHDSESNPS